MFEGLLFPSVASGDEVFNYEPSLAKTILLSVEAPGKVKFIELTILLLISGSLLKTLFISFGLE